jgi:DNA cross-link repair 1A protein
MFRLPDGRNILHTGDFRASEEMESYPALQGTRISQLYLDTTLVAPVLCYLVDYNTDFQVLRS